MLWSYGSQVTTYMKLVTAGVKHHLAVADQGAAGDADTLCGCLVTRPHHWKRVAVLEGDECPQCATLAFGGGAVRSDSSHGL